MQLQVGVVCVCGVGGVRGVDSGRWIGGVVRPPEQTTVNGIVSAIVLRRSVRGQGTGTMKVLEQFLLCFGRGLTRR